MSDTFFSSWFSGSMTTQHHNHITLLKDVFTYGCLAYFTIRVVKEIIRCRDPRHAILPQHRDLILSGRRAKPDDRFFAKMYMQNRNGLWLYWRCWRCDPSKVATVKGVVFVCEGMGDSTMRYGEWAEFVNSLGYHMYLIDHQGQGSSEGERKYFERFSHVVDDFEDFVSYVLAKQGGKQEFSDLLSLPKFLFGHSLGGLISTRLSQRCPQLFRGVILSAPALHIDEVAYPQWMRSAAKTLSELFPKFTIPLAQHKVKFTRNEALELNCDLDYLNTMDLPITARVGAEILNATALAVAEAPTKSTTPLLVLHGVLDTLTPITGSRAYVAAAAATDKTLKEYPNLLHDFFFDAEETDRVRADIAQWLDKRSGGAS